MIVEKGLTAPRVTTQRIQDVIIKEEYHNFEGTTVTICLLTLENGYNVTGESACASVENFNIEVGKRIAKENAESKIWSLEGYLLKDKLHNGTV